MIKQKNRGLTLIETLIYVLGFVIVLVTIVFLIFNMTRMYRQVRVSQELENTLSITIDRILRETRDARSIDLTDTVLGTSPGKLKLNTTDVEGDSKTVTIYLDDGVVYLEEDDVLVGAITSDLVNVSNLTFNSIDTGISIAVRVEISASATIGNSSKDDTYYGAAILRESY